MGCKSVPENTREKRKTLSPPFLVRSGKISECCIVGRKNLAGAENSRRTLDRVTIRRSIQSVLGKTAGNYCGGGVRSVHLRSLGSVRKSGSAGTAVTENALVSACSPVNCLGLFPAARHVETLRRCFSMNVLRKMCLISPELAFYFGSSSIVLRGRVISPRRKRTKFRYGTVWKWDLGAALRSAIPGASLEETEPDLVTRSEHSEPIPRR